MVGFVKGRGIASFLFVCGPRPSSFPPSFAIIIFHVSPLWLQLQQLFVCLSFHNAQSRVTKEGSLAPIRISFARMMLFFSLY